MKDFAIVLDDFSLIWLSRNIFLSEELAMKNDTTWEHSDNSEQDKQQAASSHGKLVGSRSKTPSPIPHSPSPLRSKTSALCSLLSALSSGSRRKTITHLRSLLSARLHGNQPRHLTKAHFLPFPFSLLPSAPSSFSKMKLPNQHTIRVLLVRKAWLTGQLEGGKQGKEIPSRLKNYLNAESNALTRVIDFTNMMFKYIPDKQMLQEILCQYEREAVGSEQ
jgi:hypothetical protein